MNGIMRTPPSCLTLSRRWIREVDRRAIEEYGIPGLLLMENAARGVVDQLLRLGCQGPVVIACGKGNNGGDGLAIARWLDLYDVRVRILLFANPPQLTGDALVNYQMRNVPSYQFGSHGRNELTHNRASMRPSGVDYRCSARNRFSRRNTIHPSPPLSILSTKSTAIN